MALADGHCVPCRGDTPPLTEAEIAPLLAQLEDWLLPDGHLKRTYRFPDFVEAVRFVNEITEVAEAEGHHPDLHVAWGRVTVELWTHKINGLTESDFILAAKIDRLYAGSESLQATPHT